MKQLKPLRLLIVEDNKADFILTEKAFSKSKISYELDHAIDGDVALKMLKQEKGYEDFIRPNLILLDLNMPKKDGKAFIKDIKKQKDINNIPIIIVSGAAEEAKVLFEKDKNVNGYIVKAGSQKEYKSIVKEIETIIFGAFDTSPRKKK